MPENIRMFEEMEAVLLKSPNGTIYKITVDNDGKLVTEEYSG